MDTGKIFPSQQIDIICQLFRIAPSFHKGNHTFISLTVFVHQFRKLLPYRVFSSLTVSGISSQNFKLYLFSHDRSCHPYRFRGQIAGGGVKR